MSLYVPDNPNAYLRRDDLYVIVIAVGGGRALIEHPMFGVTRVAADDLEFLPEGAK